MILCTFRPGNRIIYYGVTFNCRLFFADKVETSRLISGKNTWYVLQIHRTKKGGKIRVGNSQFAF